MQRIALSASTGWESRRKPLVRHHLSPLSATLQAPAPSSFLSKAYRLVCICLLTYSECLHGHSLTMQLELIVNKLTPIILTNLILQSSE